MFDIWKKYWLWYPKYKAASWGVIGPFLEVLRGSICDVRDWTSVNHSARQAIPSLTYCTSFPLYYSFPKDKKNRRDKLGPGRWLSGGKLIPAIVLQIQSSEAPTSASCPVILLSGTKGRVLALQLKMYKPPKSELWSLLSSSYVSTTWTMTTTRKSVRLSESTVVKHASTATWYVSPSGSHNQIWVLTTIVKTLH